jgi:hypothetical protein
MAFGNHVSPSTQVIKTSLTTRLRILVNTDSQNFAHSLDDIRITNHECTLKILTA